MRSARARSKALRSWPMRGTPRGKLRHFLGRRTEMRWIVWAVAAIALLALVVVIVGALLPRAHTASRTVRVALPPDALYALLADVSRYQSWRAGLKSLERLPDKQGMPAWIEDANGMKIPMRFERMEPPSLIVA